jgi:hypothetical protein
MIWDPEAGGYETDSGIGVRTSTSRLSHWSMQEWCHGPGPRAAGTDSDKF